MVIKSLTRLDMRKIRQLIAQIVSLPETSVIDADDTLDPIAFPEYLTLNVARQTEIGRELTFNAKEGIETLESMREVTLSVNAYGPQSYEMIDTLTLAIGLSHVSHQLQRLGLGFLRASTIKHLSTTETSEAKRGTEVELIFSFNYIIRAYVQSGTSVNIITEVNP